MVDATTVHIGENSPEHVAYRLMRDIASVKGKILATSDTNAQKVASRQWILDTYAECLQAVRIPHQRRRDP